MLHITQKKTEKEDTVDDPPTLQTQLKTHSLILARDFTQTFGDGIESIYVIATTCQQLTGTATTDSREVSTFQSESVLLIPTHNHQPNDILNRQPAHNLPHLIMCVEAKSHHLLAAVLLAHRALLRTLHVQQIGDCVQISGPRALVPDAL